MTARVVSIAVMLAAGVVPVAWADEPVLGGRCRDGRTWTANADDAGRMLAQSACERETGQLLDHGAEAR